MSHPQRHSTATTTHPDSALNDQRHLLSDPYPTPSTSPSLSPTQHHNHPPSSPLSYSTSTTSSTATNTSSSSYHTIAGAAAAHLIKQKQQLQQQQQQAILDNARTLPAKVRGSSTTTATAIFNIPAPPRKSGGSRIGQSILGQLLAAHSPGGRNNSGGGGSELSSETHRPKEQQRRSVFPASWGLNFSSSSSKSRAMQQGGPSLPSRHSSTAAAPSTAAAAAAAPKGVAGSAVPLGGPLLPSHLVENPEPIDRLQPVLPSVWLESILSGLSRADLNTPPHYATLPRVNWQDEQQQQQPPIFPGLGPRLKKEDRPSSSNRTRVPSSAAVAGGGSGTRHPPPHPDSSTSTLHPRAQQTLHKKSSVCELALGDDARELFQQNRPKTLSSAVIQSQIVPMKESLRNNMRQRSLDSSASLAPSSGAANKPVSEPSSNHRASSGSVITIDTSSSSAQATPATVKTTRGRFTIESQSALPSPARTRTLSCASTTALNYGESSSYSSSYSSSLTPSSTLSSGGLQDRGMSPRRMDRTVSYPVTPSSPKLSHSFPSSRSLHSPSFPPSPRLSPLSADYTNSNGDSSNSINTTSSPISIPSRAPSPASSSTGRSSHQRSQSNTSSTSSSRFSQVIIPPPASAASLQFASFSSIGSPPRHSVPSASPTVEPPTWAAPSTGDSLVTEKRPNNSGGSNNIRNLSIQIVDADRTSRNSSRASRRTLEYEGEPTPVHPLDEDLAASASTTPATTGGAVAREDGLIRTHQTMNRVHPALDQDFVDSPGCSESSSSLDSRVGGIGTFMGQPDRRASDNAHQKQYESGGGFGYFDRTSPGSFRPRSLSATNLDSVGTNNGSTPSLHQQLSWADRTAMQREGSSHSRSFDTGTPGTPPASASSSSLSPHIHGGELSDVVMVKKSAKGRMFTVERQSTLPPASPTKSSRFIVVSSTEDMCLSPPSSLSPRPHALH
ncbi:hypothetical protein EC957_004580 [Mortierella hygrophila]|uniref:Uncharacterized protein n=1 Tax=Mortierella hygrophila TaxID=979708 RepID=A0A9P6F1G6_9FUNG|nr:hypothetical protein EC957_004580 [Mortierella hygrophila]